MIKFIYYFVEKVFIKLSGIITIILLFSLIGFLSISSLGFFANYSPIEFFFNTEWEPSEGRYSVLPLLYGSLLITFLAIIIAVPMSLCTAIFISEIVNKKVRVFLKIILEMFAAIPSVVFGFIGIIFLAPLIRETFNLDSGLNVVTASILLACMAIPTITSVIDESLNSVPKHVRMSSYALGANTIQTLISVVLPFASPGIFSAVMLGVGRVIGETMTVMMVAGGTVNFLGSILEPTRTITSTIAIEMGEVIFGDTHYRSLFLISFILFVITYVINLISARIVKKISLKNNLI